MSINELKEWMLTHGSAWQDWQNRVKAADGVPELQFLLVEYAKECGWINLAGLMSGKVDV